MPGAVMVVGTAAGSRGREGGGRPGHLFLHQAQLQLLCQPLSLPQPFPCPRPRSSPFPCPSTCTCRRPRPFPEFAPVPSSVPAPSPAAVPALSQSQSLPLSCFLRVSPVGQSLPLALPAVPAPLEPSPGSYPTLRRQSLPCDPCLLAMAAGEQ